MIKYWQTNCDYKEIEVMRKVPYGGSKGWQVLISKKYQLSKFVYLPWSFIKIELDFDEGFSASVFV